MSAGVSVAYFTSVALLALAATRQPMMGEEENPTTYFDTVVLLTMFLLAGKQTHPEVVFLPVADFSRGRYLEAYSKSRTADAVSSLGKLRPSTALLVVPKATAVTLTEPSTGDPSSDLEKGIPEVDELSAKAGMNIAEIDASVLEIGDIVLVRKGSSPPADGVVALGETFFDESSLTGESKPIKKGLGDEVFLGTINHGRAVDVRVSSLDGQNM